jgi:phosphate:Na+ symporter
MARTNRGRRWRVAAAWVLSAAVIGGYYLSGDDAAEESRGPKAPPAGAKPDDNDKLEIVDVAGDPTPGSALQVRFLRRDTADPRPVKAILSVPTPEGTRAQTLQTLHAAKDEIVVRLPPDAPPERHKLRLQQGDDRETRSKPYDLRVKAVNRQKLYRNVIGGLALLVFGLHTLSSGARAYTGHRVQEFLARISSRTPTAVGLGVVVGGVTQFTTSAAGLVVGLIESHLLTAGPATAMLLGAQFGAAAIPSVLGLTATAREGVLLVTVGVLWLILAGDRRGKALGHVILGCGLLFFGLNMLHIGFEPLVSDPEIIPVLNRFQADQWGGLLACVGAGALLAAVLQGPAPVFAIVLGLTQATGQLDMQSALAILAGTGVGAAAGVAVVSWPFGREARRLALLYFSVAVLGTAALAATVDLWAYVADALVSGRPTEVAYGKKVLLPHAGKHLVTGFALSQLAATGALAAALPLLLRLLKKRPTAAVPKAAAPAGAAARAEALRNGISRVIGLEREALTAVLDLCLEGRRERGVDGEHALADARAELEAMFGGAVRATSDDPDLARLRQVALATLQLQRAVEDLLNHAERGIERSMALSAAGNRWQPSASEEAKLRSLHGLLLEGMDALDAQLRNGMHSDLDAARAREIRLNAMEAESRQALLAQSGPGEDSRLISLRLNATDLINAYENVGNHLYRLHEAASAEVEQDA